MKKILGLSLHETTIGGYDSSGFQGQINVASNSRSNHEGARLVELDKQISKLFANGKYTAVAVQRPMYGIDVEGFDQADKLARMVGVVMLSSCKAKVQCLLLDPTDVCRLATGKRNATLPEMKAAAAHNGKEIKTECVSVAYWIMCLGLNKLGS